jgi:hypothetical protein
MDLDPYLPSSLSPLWICIRSSHIRCPPPLFLTKFDVSALHLMLLGICEFSGGRYREGLSFPTNLNQITFNWAPSHWTTRRWSLWLCHGLRHLQTRCYLITLTYTLAVNRIVVYGRSKRNQDKSVVVCLNYYILSVFLTPEKKPRLFSGCSTDCLNIGQDTVIGTTTFYELEGPGIESRWGRGFTHPSSLTLGPIQPLVPWVPSLLLGVKRPGRGVDHPPPSSAKVKERVELYLYSRSVLL